MKLGKLLKLSNKMWKRGLSMQLFYPENEDVATSGSKKLDYDMCIFRPRRKNAMLPRR